MKGISFEEYIRSCSFVRLCLFSLLDIIVFLFSYHYFCTSMASICSNNDTWWLIPVFALTSTHLAIGVFAFCIRINHLCRPVIRFIEYIGQKTLVILTFHLLAFKIVNYILVIIHDLNKLEIGLYPTIISKSSEGWWVVYTLIGVLLPLAITQGWRIVISKIKYISK